MTSRALGIILLALLLPAPIGADPGGPAPEFEEDALARPPSVAERLAEIQRRIQAAAIYPPLARRRGITGTTHIRFEIDAAGKAARIETSRSSGSSLLDRAAEQSARAAGKLPQIYGRLEVPIRFALDRRP